MHIMTYGGVTSGKECFNGKESACQCRRGRRHGLDHQVRKIHWSRKWQPTPVFLPRKSHGVWWGTIHRVKRVGHDWVHTPFHAQLIYNYVLVCVSFKCAARTSAIYTFFFRFFSLIGYYNILSRVSCAIHRSWLGIYYISVSAPWRRAWQPTPVFLPGEAPWTEEPGGLQSTGSQSIRLNTEQHSVSANPILLIYTSSLHLR